MSVCRSFQFLLVLVASLCAGCDAGTYGQRVQESSNGIRANQPAPAPQPAADADAAEADSEEAEEEPVGEPAAQPDEAAPAE